jgi:hypothetical protein
MATDIFARFFFADISEDFFGRLFSYRARGALIGRLTQTLNLNFRK